MALAEAEAVIGAAKVACTPTVALAEAVAVRLAAIVAAVCGAAVADAVTVSAADMVASTGVDQVIDKYEMFVLLVILRYVAPVGV